MPIAANTAIKIGLHAPKKDATIHVGSPGTTDNFISIWAAAAINPALTQSIVGGFRQLARYAKANISSISGNPAVIHMPFGGSEASIVVNGTPPASHLRIHVGSTAHGSGASHLLDRAFKSLIDRWLEESKGGVV